MIFYFSGTDNSLWVTRNLAEYLEDEKVIAIGDYFSLGNELIPKFSVEENERIGFVFPTHSWGIPPIVKQFIKKLEIDNYKKNLIYAIVTCGDQCGYTDKMLQKLFREKAWKTEHIYSLQMPNNYIIFPSFDVDNKELEEQKKVRAEKTLPVIMQLILDDYPLDYYTKGNAAFLKSRIIHPLFCKYAMNDKDFYADDKCISCGICSNVCPVKNVILHEAKPKWLGNCTQCLACIHHCPETAIQYGNKTQNKGRYTFYN
ncbi:EFR1 family ferrodoxin [Bacteroidales bacterium OttesenSCG-928-K03]|nr:EFR1 family ferrodoxin [Odoribacter sp. OttesenSCG-928-L07]MDL2242438.1 EFR1 family ferrodoxin [Bacteroidales bacterium OttesenSCG-928-K03]